MIIGLCFLVIFGIFIPPVNADPVDPYIRPLEGRVTTHSNEVIQSFPSYLTGMFHPGIVSNLEGNRYCQIESEVPDFHDCEEFSAEIEGIARRSHADEFTAKVNDPVTFQEKGLPVTVQDDGGTGIYTMRFGANPQKLENHKEVLEYLEKTVLQDAGFFNLDTEEILQSILKTHEHMVQKLPAAYGLLKGGEFRDQAMVITGERSGNSFNELSEIVLQRGGTQTDVRNLKKVIQKMNKYGSFEKAKLHFTKKELKSFGKLGHIPPAPEELAEEMSAFVEQMKELGPQVIDRTVDGVAAAAWVHQEIGRIHPFEDANGRVARSWMNTFLQLGGYEAVIFPNDDLYTEAVDDDQRRPGNFANYLSEIIGWNREQKNLD